VFGHDWGYTVLESKIIKGCKVRSRIELHCYNRDNRLRSKTLSIVREVGSGLYLNKQNASDEVLSVLK